MRYTDSSDPNNAHLAQMFLIRDVTGHKSNALQLYMYEQPSAAQKEAVSGILVQEKRSFAEEVDKEKASGSCSIAQVRTSGYPVQQARIAAPLHLQWSGTVLGSLFSGLSNCSVNTCISPQNFVVNVNPPSVPYVPDVDSLLDGIELKDLM